MTDHHDDSPAPKSTTAAKHAAAEFARERAAGIAPHETDGLYRLLVESVRDYAIFALDANGFILSWNPGAQRFNGYTAEEAIGRHFSMFYPKERIDQGFPDYELRMAARDGQFFDEGWRLRKDGTRFWASVVITALRDEAGMLVGFAKVTRDLTERRDAAERAVEDARRLAASEAANRTKSEFLAAMSHELRTPLNAIGGYSELLLEGIYGAVSEDQREVLQRIRRSQQHLLTIISDLLNYSRIEAGQVAYDLGPVSLEAVVDAVTPMIAPQARRRHLAFVRAPVTTAPVAHADRARVEQVLLNLLSNAVKFTPEGGRIEVSSFVLDGQAALRVRDTGPGIPIDHLEAVFEPFVQLGRSLTTGHEGTGLGLAISRDLARAMGGNLVADSAPGQGATFTLTLPLAAPNER